MESARGAAKEKAKKKYERLKDQYKKLKISRTDKVFRYQKIKTIENLFF